MTIINGNSYDELKKLPDESVDCVITSPPYYGLRSYKGAETEWEDWKGQLGLEPTYQMYLGHLLMVTRELKRVLKETGTLFWNMGDSYAGKMGKRQGWTNNKIVYTKEEALENGTSIHPNADYGNIQDKSLMMLPERFAIGMIDQGWTLRNKIIWYKRNGMPSSVKDRFNNKWEYVFFFAKSKKYFFDLDAVRKPLKESSVKRISQNVQLQFNTGKVHDFPEDNMNMKKILLHMKQKYEEEGGGDVGRHSGYFNADGSLHVNSRGVNPGDVINTPAVRSKSWYSNAGHGYTHERKYDIDADGGDFWDITTRSHKFAHFAVYPETLIEPMIKAGCPPDGIVLDPFAGSGTTGVVAQKLGRSAILIEISPDYVEIIKQRLSIERNEVEKVKQ